MFNHCWVVQTCKHWWEPGLETIVEVWFWHGGMWEALWEWESLWENTWIGCSLCNLEHTTVANSTMTSAFWAQTHDSAQAALRSQHRKAKAHRNQKTPRSWTYHDTHRHQQTPRSWTYHDKNQYMSYSNHLWHSQLPSHKPHIFTISHLTAWKTLASCICEGCHMARHSGRWEIGCGVWVQLHSQSSCTTVTHPRLGALPIFTTLRMQGIWCQSWMGHCLEAWGFTAVWPSPRLQGFLADTVEGTLWGSTCVERGALWEKEKEGSLWERERKREREMEIERERESTPHWNYTHAWTAKPV